MGAVGAACEAAVAGAPAGARYGRRLDRSVGPWIQQVFFRHSKVSTLTHRSLGILSLPLDKI